MARKKIDEDQLEAYVANEIWDALNYIDSDATESRALALNYYNGVMPDVPPEDGWSSVVSRDTSDVIGWILPGVVRVFTASDRIVDYQPERPGDEDFCQQASDYINYAFWTDNPGYRVLWDSTQDSLLMADGFVKTWWDDTKEYATESYSGLLPEEIALLTEDETQDIEIVSQKAGPPVMLDQPPEMDEQGQPVQSEPILVPTFDVKIKRTTLWGKLRFKAIAPENFLIDRDALDIENARFVAQRDPRVTRSDLIRMGFDKKKVEEIPRFNGLSEQVSEVEIARNRFTAGLGDPADIDKSMDRIELYEIYLRRDVNGDGIAERLRIYYAGNGSTGCILEWEEYDDEVPFDQIPCTPVPHRFFSDSVAGEVMDIQRIKTVLYRQALNNTYQVNNPQKVVEEDSIVNMDEAQNPTIGGTLIQKPNSAPIVYNVVPSILPNALQAIDSMNAVIEFRTGVSRATMALDPDTLQNQTATANQNQRDSAYSQIELVARNMSELGWKNVFKKALRVVVKHQDRPRTIRLRDEWVDMDPRSWNANMDAVVNTGLGTGSRERDLMMLQQVGLQQEKIGAVAQQFGMPEIALDMFEKAIKTSIKGAEAAGLRNAADYFPSFGEEEKAAALQMIQDQAGQPTPEEKQAMAEMQLKQAQAQSDAQLQAQKQRTDAELKMQQMQMDMQLKREQMAAEVQMQRERMVAELAMEQERMRADMQLKRETGFMNGMAKGASIGNPVRMGGEVG